MIFFHSANEMAAAFSSGQLIRMAIVQLAIVQGLTRWLLCVHPEVLKSTSQLLWSHRERSWQRRAPSRVEAGKSLCPLPTCPTGARAAAHKSWPRKVIHRPQTGHFCIVERQQCSDKLIPASWFFFNTCSTHVLKF